MAYRERSYTAQDGLSLYFRDYGDAAGSSTPVLCLAGLTRNSADFDAFARRLSPSRRVVCPDYRGRGRSDYDPDWRHYVPGTYINDIVHLLAAANLHRVVVVGTSLGGLLAMGLAVAVPSALAGVVLNDAGPEVGGASLGTIIDFIGRDRPQPDLESAIADFRTALPNVRFQTEAAYREAVEHTYRKGADGLLHFDWDVAVVRPLRSARSPVPDMWPLFRALAHVPVLALRGELSEFLSPECFERMAGEAPELKRVVVPGTGHTPTLDEPECRTAIDEFLAGV